MIFRAWLRHVLLSLYLNFQSPQGIVYAYLVPLIFLLAFAAVFRTDEPPLAAHMGQLLTITTLGGACFGLPTALVAERERGIWRRYRLLPIPVAWLVVGTMLARLAIVVSSVLLQLALARAIFGAPLPAYKGSFAAGFIVVSGAFLGIGLLIASLAENVPAVQALGQCIFLPMILIGGVGVPLAVLPEWAQSISGFMPGRYAVEALSRPFDQTRFALAALAVIGGAAGVAGARLFRWDTSARPPGAPLWVTLALAAWAAVGAFAWTTGRLAPASGSMAWRDITPRQIDAITFDGLPADNDIAANIAPASSPPGDIDARLNHWAPGQLRDAGQSIRNLVAIAAIADLTADQRESAIARAVCRAIRGRFASADAKQALAWVILDSEDGTVVRQAPELGLRRHPPERLVRERSVIYAKKFLGRVLGRLPD